MKRLLPLIIAALLIVFMNFNMYGDTPIGEYRKNLLDKVKKDTKILEDGKICRSKHFAVYIGSPSLKDLGLDKGEELQDLMLRVCFVFEEAYRVVGEQFDRFPSNMRLKVDLRSPEMYRREAGEDSSGLVSKQGVVLPISAASMRDPLDDFSEGIPHIYYGYARLFLYTIKGPDFYAESSTEIAKYFEEVGEKTSYWNGQMTGEKRSRVLDSINAEHTSLFKKYPEFFKKKSVDKNFMTCKWCGKDLDITGKRKGKRIMCPHCRNPLYVE